MLANYECDLHGHTNRSDGNDSPVEYIRHAVHRGVKILAITAVSYTHLTLPTIA